MNNKANIKLNGEELTVEQSTDYPWNGKIMLTITPDKTEKFSLLVRIPGWARNEALPTDLYHFNAVNAEKSTIRINGVRTDFQLRKGYAVITRNWKKGDQLIVELPMPVREIVAHPNIVDDRGKIALQRGPLVYCTEWADNMDSKVLSLTFHEKNNYSTKFVADLLNGVTIIQTSGNSSNKTSTKESKQQIITAIPYYAWANRGQGEMSVWQKVQK